jgi:ABC-type transport system involved in multi-copper enzyme maturation permease subunit
MKTFNIRLWLKQIGAILRLEIKKAFLGRRLIGVYFLAFAPVVLFGIRASLPLRPNEIGNIGMLSIVYAGFFQVFMLRLAVFFGCVGIFGNLFRGEVLEKTLHYYFLTPVRREVLVVGKYAAGLIAATSLFGFSAAATFILIYLPAGTSAHEFFFNGPGIQQLFAYLGTITLACIGYGSVFLLIGLLVRNPIIPAALLLGWENINFLLPPLLKKISVIHYLQSLCPVAIPHRSIEIIAEPTPAWIAIPGLLVVTAVLLALAGLKIRKTEVSYSSE